MSDLVNALQSQNRSSSVLGAIANPTVVNPLADITAGVGAARNIVDLRQQQQALSQAQMTQQLTKLNYTAGTLADLLNQPGQITADQVRAAAMQHVGDGITDENTVNQVLSTMPQNTADNPNAVRGWVRQLQIANLSHQQAIMAGFQPTTFNTGGQLVTQNVPTMPGVGGAGAPSVTLNTGLSPGETLQGGIHYPATDADVKAGRASAVGQDVFVPGPEVLRRAGIPLPPGLQGGSTGTGAPGVVDSSGKPVGPANPPRLLNVPGQSNPPPSPPAPTGGPPAPPAVGGNVGIGAALNPATAPPAAAPPVPPVPPPSAPAPPATPPVPGPAPIWNPNNPVGTSAITPSTANPAIAAAQTQAKATGRPVPIPGGSGLVANPDGSVSTPGGGFRAAPPLPPNAPQAALQGGTQVASTNALVPSVGPPGPPSPLVPGNVNAIMAGINRARGTPVQGTQTAFNTIATGPGTEEAQGYKTSADTLAAYDQERANYQQTQFPYVQALKNYGEGTKTGPTTDFWNQVAGTIRTPLAKIGINWDALSDNTQRVDALGKWLASIQSGNPMAAKSDAELAQVLKGSASTHINEVAGEDMVKAGLSLLRMKVAADADWHNNPQNQQQYGTFLNFLGHYNQTTDPRAFAIDTYNPAQIARLRSQLQKGTEADAQRFEDSLAIARRNGVIGGAGSQAMP
jgi:hypothetical protein